MESYNPKINEDQLQAFKSGDVTGFNYFFNLYYKPLCYFVFSLVKDEPLAEEITDDAFLKLWERHDSFESENKIKAFLYTVTRNASLTHLRNSKTQATSQSHYNYLTETSEPCIQSHIIKAETIDLIYQSLHILPEKSRQVFKLFYLENKSYEEIVDELQLPVNNVRNYKMRALSILRKKLRTSLLLLVIATLMHLSNPL